MDRARLADLLDAVDPLTRADVVAEYLERARERGRAELRADLRAYADLNGSGPTFLKAFDESLHPRDHGKFAESSGGEGDRPAPIEFHNEGSHDLVLRHAGALRRLVNSVHRKQATHDEVAPKVQEWAANVGGKLARRYKQAWQAADRQIQADYGPDVLQSQEYQDVRTAFEGALKAARGVAEGIAESADSAAYHAHGGDDTARQDWTRDLLEQVDGVRDRLGDEHNAIYDALEALRDKFAGEQKGEWKLGRYFKAWSETDHPRDHDGKFLPKGEIEAAKSDPAKAAELRGRVRPEDAAKLEKHLEGGELEPAAKSMWEQTPAEFAASGGKAFRTSQGSLYAHRNGKTARVKSEHFGHDKADTGLKKPSDETHFIDPEDAKRVGMWQTSSAPNKRVMVKDGYLHLTSWNAATGKQGRDGVPIKLHSEPVVGLAPMELWDKSSQGEGVWKGTHPGSAITEFVDPAAAHGEFTAAARKLNNPELNKLLDKAAKAKPAAPAKKPAAKPPTVDQTHALVQKLTHHTSTVKSAEAVRRMAEAFQQHTHAELAELKQRLGIKASGPKAELARKLAERAAHGDKTNLRQRTAERVSVDDAHRQIQDHLAAGRMDDPETVKQVAGMLSKQMSVSDLRDLKKRLGVKASGPKWELARKIAERAVAKKVDTGAALHPSHVTAYRQAKELTGSQGKMAAGVRMRQDVVGAAAKQMGVDYHEAESALESATKAPAGAVSRPAVAPAVQTPLVPAKTPHPPGPWQQEREGYVAAKVAAAAKASRGRSPYAAPDTRATDAARAKAEKEWDENNEAAYVAGEKTHGKPAWAKTGVEWANHPAGPGPMTDHHRGLVSAALAAGRPVPADVLADYPDLAPSGGGESDLKRPNVSQSGPDLDNANPTKQGDSGGGLHNELSNVSQSEGGLDNSPTPQPPATDLATPTPQLAADATRNVAPANPQPAKAPHEMTRAEYLKENTLLPAIRYTDRDREFVVGEPGQTHAEVGLHASGGKQETRGRESGWFDPKTNEYVEYDDAFARMGEGDSARTYKKVRDRHEAAVTLAVASGKEVPPAVLAEYPALATRAPKPPAIAAPQPPATDLATPPPVGQTTPTPTGGRAVKTPTAPTLTADEAHAHVGRLYDGFRTHTAATLDAELAKIAHLPKPDLVRAATAANAGGRAKTLGKAGILAAIKESILGRKGTADRVEQ